MARAALKITVADLAKRADMRAATITHFEKDGDSRRSTVSALQKQLEAAGAVFVGDGEASLAGGPGVRLRG